MNKEIFISDKKYKDALISDEQIKKDYGEDYEIADFKDIKALKGHAESFLEKIGLRDHGEHHVMLKYYGSLKNGQNQYFLEYHRTKDVSWVSYNDSLFPYELGSWYGLDMPVLVIKKKPKKKIANKIIRNDKIENEKTENDEYNEKIDCSGIIIDL